MLSTPRPDPPTSRDAGRPTLDGADHGAPPSPIVSAVGLGKRYDIYPNDRSRFFEFLGSRTHHTEHWSVRGVDFSVSAGQAFGVVGSNGAGKSTLLRLLAGISEPTEGSISVQGRMATLLDLGVGFHAPFSGRENIGLGCALAGMSPPEIESRVPEIIRFAELGDFIDHPVRTYSTGMQLRLGFAIAVHSDARVLLIDEVLAVGDQYFQRKCIRRIERSLAEGCSLIVVSHDLHAIRALCSEVLWLDRGRPRLQGNAREVVEEYVGVGRTRLAALVGEDPPPPVPAVGAEPSLLRRAGPDPKAALPAPVPTAVQGAALQATLVVACAVPDAAGLFLQIAGEAPRVVDGDKNVVSGTGEVRILRVQLLDASGAERERYWSGEALVIAVTFRTTEVVVDPIFGAAIHRDDGVYVFGPNTGFDQALKGRFHGIYTFYLYYPSVPLLQGNFRVSVAVFDAGHVKAYVWHNELYPFSVEQQVEDHGIVTIPHSWGVLAWHEADG
ncbi:MAG: ABC transporter ATP-binding protein [Myxococcales bacterium]|nr:ABC transporter ATP-binding protein [Myxococcales bacterium]